ncbi:hypothetical protein NDU88_005135 [Pleurodeles waltl]|uniref:Uncharacterized protein n=1 Tax=Pleurodeles waltl TaxID=8319 RepID=A0AAV7UHA2_PLEWA|nr:hypothetical protein NDU88_005135 [Pleurodeles waltl]
MQVRCYSDPADFTQGHHNTAKSTQGTEALPPALQQLPLQPDRTNASPPPASQCGTHTSSPGTPYCTWGSVRSCDQRLWRQIIENDSINDAVIDPVRAIVFLSALGGLT